MALAYNPWGLAPQFHESGTIRISYPSAPIASGYASNIFQNSPVRIDDATPNGNLILCTALGNGSANPAAASYMIGSLQGVQFILTATGRMTVSNYWPANTVATQITAWYTRDPNITYVIQANGSIPQSALQKQISLTANGSANGNTTTGFSSVGADEATLTGAGGSSNQLRITGFDLGFVNGAQNQVGDAFTVLQVKIALHQDVAKNAVL